MKVKCTQVTSQATGKAMEDSPWVTLDKEYVVLALKISPKYGISILIHGDQENSPIFPYLIGFEIMSQYIPSTWETEIEKNGDIYMMPKSWMGDTFLDDVDDYVPEAFDIFHKESQMIMQEEIEHEKKLQAKGLKFMFGNRN